MHLALELDQSKQVSADPKRDLDLALTVLRKRIDEFGVERAPDPEGGRRPDRGRAARHHRARRAPRRSSSGARSSSSGSPTRPARSRRRCPRWTGCSAGWACKGDAARRGKPSAVEQLLGGDSAKKAAARRAAKARPDQAGAEGQRPTARPAGATPAGRRGPAACSRPDPGGRRGGRPRRASTSCPRRRSRGWTACSTSRPWRGSCRAAWCCAGRRRPPASACSQYRFLYALDDRPIVTGSNLEDARAAARPAHQRADRHLPARPRRRPEVRRRDRPPRRRLHGDRARRAGAGPPAGHPEPDRPERPDHARRQDASRRRRTSRSRSRPARCRFRSRSSRSGRSARASAAIRSGRASPPASSARAHGHPDHAGLLPLLRRARGGGARALRPVHARRARRCSTPRSRCRGSPASCSRSASRSTRTC